MGFGGIAAALLRAAPGQLAARQSGLNRREETDYKRAQLAREQALEEQARQQAMAQSLREFQSRQDETRATRDLNESYRRDALKSAGEDRDLARGQQATLQGERLRQDADQRERDRVARGEQAKLVAAVSGNRAGDVQAQRNFQREQALSSDYERATKDLAEAHQFVSGALKNVPLAQSGNGAAQVELLYAFVRALDPNSAVREGEVALARQAAKPWSMAKGLLDKYTRNKSVVVPPDLVAEMADLMGKRVSGYEQRVGDIRKGYLTRAQRAALQAPEDLFPGVGGTPAGRRSLDEIAGKAKPFPAGMDRP